MIVLGYCVLATCAAVVVGCVYLIVSQRFRDHRDARLWHSMPGAVSADDFDLLVEEWTR